ncbi:Hypothetical_protein [Hexamita inflata]|uniref:Hypothetical_protein n=1 Tax=Hexamita inflata TaxID=28002 RepID=A0AA86UXQ0_9EUKA|nr:Hypothetical protein HINF_LOCUS56341 [Hexamita inflata]
MSKSINTNTFNNQELIVDQDDRSPIYIQFCRIYCKDLNPSPQLQEAAIIFKTISDSCASIIFDNVIDILDEKQHLLLILQQILLQKQVYIHVYEKVKLSWADQDIFWCYSALNTQKQNELCQSQLHQSKLQIQQLFCKNVLNQSITIQEMQTKLQSIIQIQNTKQQTQNEIILNSFVKLTNLSIKQSVKLNIAKDLSSLISKTVKNVNQQILKVFQTNNHENNYFKFVSPSAQIKKLPANQKPNLNLNQTETNGVETQTQLITKRNFNEFKLEYVNKLKTKQQNNLKYKLTKFAGQEKFTEKQKKTLKESQNNELELLEQLIEKLITINDTEGKLETEELINLICSAE